MGMKRDSVISGFKATGTVLEIFEVLKMFEVICVYYIFHHNLKSGKNQFLVIFQV